jgi:hypothetical protein
MDDLVLADGHLVRRRLARQSSCGTMAVMGISSLEDRTKHLQREEVPAASFNPFLDQDLRPVQESRTVI